MSSFRVYSAASLAVVLVYDSSGIQLKGASRNMGEECLRLLVAAQLHNRVIDVVVCMVPCSIIMQEVVTRHCDISTIDCFRTPRIVALVRCRVPSGYHHTNWSRRYERERRVHSSKEPARCMTSHDITQSASCIINFTTPPTHNCSHLEHHVSESCCNTAP